MGQSYTPIFFLLPFYHGATRVSTKGRQTVWYQPWFCEQPSGSVESRGACSRSALPWNSGHAVREMAFLCDSPTVSHGSAKETRGGGPWSLYRFKAPIALLSMSATVVGQREKKQQWINRQRTADNSVENSVAHFPAFYEFIIPRAVSPVILTSMQPVWSYHIHSERGAGWLCGQIVALWSLWLWWVGTANVILHYFLFEPYWVSNYNLCPLVLGSLLLNWPCIYVFWSAGLLDKQTMKQTDLFSQALLLQDPA